MYGICKLPYVRFRSLQMWTHFQCIYQDVIVIDAYKEQRCRFNTPSFILSFSSWNACNIFAERMKVSYCQFLVHKCYSASYSAVVAHVTRDLSLSEHWICGSGMWHHAVQNHSQLHHMLDVPYSFFSFMRKKSKNWNCMTKLKFIDSERMY